MKNSNAAGPLRKWVVAGVAALALAGFAQSIEPAQAMPIATPMAAEPLGGASGVEQIQYRPYRHYHRRPMYRRHYGRRLPVPCRPGIRTHLSKRYC